MSKLTLNENAKEDWLKLVKKHKKKQKGLPALSTLNTDAGDVETHIKMFNKMTSPTEAPNNNPVSGPFGGNVSSSTEVNGGLSESITNEEITMNKEQFDLYYPELTIEDVPTGEVIRGNYYEPDEWVTTDVTIPYDYSVDKSDVEFVIGDLDEFQDKYWPEDMPSEEIDKFIHEHFDELYNEFEEQILDHYYEDAADHARENNDWEGYFEPDLYESKETKDCALDDDFDLSLRAIL